MAKKDEPVEEVQQPVEEPKVEEVKPEEVQPAEQPVEQPVGGSINDLRNP